MLGYLVQFGGESAHPGPDGLLGPLLLIIAGAAVGGLLLPTLRFLVPRVRRALAGRRMRRRRMRAAEGAERRARALMSELCPHGWRAQMTLFEGQAGLPNGEPVKDAVALDWYEMRPGGEEPAVMRRVWAPTVADALEAMLADRRTDEALEQIELRASADGALWDDL